MLVGIATVQVGAGIAVHLFDQIGAAGTAFLRLAFAAVVLLALWRPQVRGRGRAQLGVALVFGLTLGSMNWAFYTAIDHIPLGAAVTLEFLGPLGVAVAGSRGALDLLWVLLAAGGVVLLVGVGDVSGGLDAFGAAMALLAGAFWAAYILLSARTGQVFPGGSGLALAMVVGALVIAPAGIAQGGAELLEPGLLAAGAAIALASSVIPYSLELEALRTLPPRVFGVLMSLEPAVAALAGLLVLGQGLGVREVRAIGLVVAASVGASCRSSSPPTAD